MSEDWLNIQSALDAGGVVLLPTETVYGLAARVDRPDAISKIYAVKGRDFDKPLAICVRDIEQAKALAHFDKTSERLAKTYWPGSLTVVLDARTALDPRVTGDTNGARTVALRCPDVEWRNAMDVPLALTSANRSGAPDCISYEEAMRELGDELDAGLKTKAKLSGAPSTIIHVKGKDLIVLRQGALELSDLEVSP